MGDFFFFWGWVICLVMLIIIPFRRSPTAAKAWLLLIFFEPWSGLILYLLFRKTRSPRWRKSRLKELPKKLALLAYELQDPGASSNSPEKAAEITAETPTMTLAKHMGSLPVVGGNHVDVLINYEQVIDNLIADIDEAKHHVHLLFYIFSDDRIGGKVLDALQRACQRGVKCRVLVDEVGSGRRLKQMVKRLKESNIEIYALFPLGVFGPKFARIDLRNHRKIAVIDGKIGYAGSQNLVDPLEIDRNLAYQDLVVRLRGPIVLQLQYIFVSDWYLEAQELLKGKDLFPLQQIAGASKVQALPSGPDFHTSNNHRLFVSLIHNARENIIIATPYLIPDEPLLQAMETAVARGVEVILILSEKSDHWLVQLAQKSYYEELLESGVKIYLYQKDFLHAKHMTVDHTLAVIGSSNMDIRSFDLNSELSLLIYDPRVVEDVRNTEEMYITHCRELLLNRWNQRPFHTKVVENFARLLSPLL